MSKGYNKKYVVLVGGPGALNRYDTDSSSSAIKKWIELNSKFPKQAAILCNSVDNCFNLCRDFISNYYGYVEYCSKKYPNFPYSLEHICMECENCVGSGVDRLVRTIKGYGLIPIFRPARRS